MSDSNNNTNKGGNNAMTKGRKRQYHNSVAGGGGKGGGGGNKKKSRYQPKRGSPGIILTCDTGRHGKAKREGLDIMNYYYKQQTTKSSKDEEGEENSNEDAPKKEAESKNTKLSLEEELAQLKEEDKEESPAARNKKYGPFAEYETGCRGTIFMMCTLPDCSLVPIPRVRKKEEENDEKKADGAQEEEDTKKEGEKETEEEEEVGSSSEPSSKKAKTEDNDGENNKDEKTLWDPTDMVRRIMNDLHEESKDENGGRHDFPGSRFLTRMIPIQATCFASMDEIKTTFRALLDHWVLPKIIDDGANTKQPPVPTYAIKFKKRNCGNVTRDEIINGIVAEIDDATGSTGESLVWKVNLDQPDYRIQVEICKTLCGISILSANDDDELMVKHNFNVADLRTHAAAAARQKNWISQKEKAQRKQEEEEKDEKEEDKEDEKEEDKGS